MKTTLPLNSRIPPGYPFVIDDGGRSQSKRSKQRNDCTVRALAIALNRDYDEVYNLCAYDEVYNLCAALGRKCGNGFDIRTHISEVVATFGMSAPWTPYQAVKNQSRMNPVMFCNQHPKGRYIVRTAKHVFAIVDGIAHDTFPETDDRCIYGSWSITK